MPHWLTDFCSWLQRTAFSQTLQNVEWIVPAVQTIHILAIGAVISSALIINLRLFGILATDQPLARVSARYLRVIWCTLPVLLVTGSLLIAAEPLRSLGSPAFQLKMALLVCVSIILLVYQGRLARTAPAATRSAEAPRRGGVLTVAALLLWIGIIFAGRWIAYASGK
jgi:hypothetical protein